MFTLSQTGLEKAVGEGCLVINSPVCSGRILLFPSLVLVTDLGTTDLAQHTLIEKVLCMLMYCNDLPCFPTCDCVHHMTACKKQEQEATWSSSGLKHKP